MTETETIEASVLYRPATDELRFLPEGPYPLGDGRFSWVAIQHGPQNGFGSINILDMAGKKNESFILPGRPGFAFPTNRTGVFIVGCEHTIGLFDIHDSSWQVLTDQVDQDRSGTIINDGVIWQDNLVFGTKDLEFKTKKAGLYLWRGRDQVLMRLRDDQVCSNGKAVIMGDSGLMLLDIDSPTRQLASYELDIDSAKLGPRNVVLDFSTDPAVPDGMILSPDHRSAIISFYNPNPATHGETREYDLVSGELKTVWRTTGSPQCTCPQTVIFGGRVHLVFTTAVEHMPEQRQTEAPEAGSLFVAATKWQSVSDTPIFTIT